MVDIERTHSARGPSIIERLWAELDNIMDRLMSDGLPGEEPYESQGYDVEGLQHVRDVWQAYGEERGKAQGTAYALAMMTNPYKPDIEGIRATAVERWEARQ